MPENILQLDNFARQGIDGKGRHLGYIKELRNYTVYRGGSSGRYVGGGYTGRAKEEHEFSV